MACNHGQTTYIVFVFSIYCISNFETSHWFLYVASAETTSSLRSFLIIYTKCPTKSEHRNDSTKILKNFPKKKFHSSFGEGRLRWKTELKFSNQSGDAYFHIIHKYRRCCSEIFYKVFVLKISEIPRNTPTVEYYISKATCPHLRFYQNRVSLWVFSWKLSKMFRTTVFI